jgi:hypothetical protein
MRGLTHGEMLELIEKHFETLRRQSDGDSEASVKQLARMKVGLSRGTAYKLIVKGEPLKDPEMLKHFEEVFRDLIIAEPGSDPYRQQWASIKKTMEKGDDFEKLVIIASAMGAWADIALDETRNDAERILVGRLVQYVLFYASRAQSTGTVLDVDPKVAFARGAKVNKEVVKLLLANDMPPPGMFDHCSPEAKARGYSVFRTRLISDELGWNQPITDEGRAELFARAYKNGIASVLMHIDEDFGHRDVTYSYRAFVMATHAGDWHRAGEYALTLLKFFPEILTKKISNIKAMLDDRDVWPGLAALLALRLADIPAGIRATLENPEPHHQNAVDVIYAMMASVHSSQSYLEVLEMEKTQMARLPKKAAAHRLRIGSTIDWPVTGGTISN